MPRKTIAIIGILLVLIQISGVSVSWKSSASIIVGVILVIMALKRFKNEVANNSESEGDGTPSASN